MKLLRLCPRCKRDVPDKEDWCKRCLRIPVKETIAEANLRLIRDQTEKESEKALKRIANRVDAFNMATTGVLTIDAKIKRGQIVLKCEGCGVDLSKDRVHFCNGCHPKCRCGKLSAFEVASIDPKDGSAIENLCLNCLQVEKRVVEYIKSCPENRLNLRRLARIAGYDLKLTKRREPNGH